MNYLSFPSILPFLISCHHAPAFETGSFFNDKGQSLIYMEYSKRGWWKSLHDLGVSRLYFFNKAASLLHAHDVEYALN